MKNLRGISSVLFLLLTVAISKAFPQANVYHPIPLTDASWHRDAFNILCYDAPFSLCASEIAYPDGDTIISSVQYAKIYIDFVNYQDEDTGVHFYVGAMRDDTVSKKVYFRSLSAIDEALWFDFDLEAGDTSIAATSYGLIVESVDSILISNEYHKRLNFHNSYPYPLYLIEGVGTNGGLFSNLFDGYGYEIFDKLKCFKVNGITVLEDSTYAFTACELFTSIFHPTQDNFSVVLFPNPITINQELKIDIHNDALVPIRIFDLTGRCIYTTAFQHQLTIAISDTLFKKGVYVVMLQEKNLKQQWWKLIVL